MISEDFLSDYVEKKLIRVGKVGLDQIENLLILLRMKLSRGIRRLI